MLSEPTPAEKRETRNDYAMLVVSAQGQRCMLTLLVLGVVAFLVTSVALSITLSPPSARNELVTPAPNPTRNPVSTTVASTTTRTTTQTTTTTNTARTTTPAVPVPPVNVTCPGNATIQLGSSQSPTYTGGSALGQGGCTQPQPIVVYVDVTTPPLNATLLAQQTPVQDVFPAPLAGVPTSRVSMAVGATQVVVVVASNGSALVYAWDKTLTTLLVPAFAMSSLATCNGTTSGAGPDAAPQVLWDGPAQRWLLMEPTANGLALCLYASLGGDATGAWGEAWLLDADDGYATTDAQLALWGNVYSITLAQCRLCVADRATVLGSAPTPNVTSPGYFCAAALNGLLPAFVINAWTPMHAADDVPPSASVEDAGASYAVVAGAVFMRAIDDELQYGATTLTVDLLDVEHWYGINFTSSSYFALRYKIAVADFDQSYALCPSIDVCVPTPSAWELDPVREPLMPRLSYRATPYGSAVATLTSNANGVDISRFYWFDLRFVAPYWTLFQQGISPSTDGLHKWLPSASVDVFGNLVIGYVAANVTVWPSLYASMRLASDFPLGVLRNTTLLLREGDAPSDLQSTQWGPASYAMSDPSVGRGWWFAGQYGSASPDVWGVQVSRLLMGEQLVARNWTVQDYCGSAAWCVQQITEE